MTRKATHRKIDKQYLDGRLNGLKAAGYGKTKWIEFCETMLNYGFDLSLYEARQTVSKYITVTSRASKKSFKVRFSNHRPNRYREEGGDCDFFVGRNNHSISTTDQAIEATLEHFAKDFGFTKQETANA
ncbi:MAG: hypothetical protein JJ979_02365 [Roseibium sp.]|nr:hypothetical protein [Roseibium sp.]